MSDTPLDHVLREQVPWRDDRLTECGRPANDVRSVITSDELKARIKRIGRQRAAFTVCMTCAGCVQYAKTWRDDPVAVVRRECERVGYSSSEPDYQRLNGEFRAVAALIAAHRDEFDGFLSGLHDTVDLQSRRRRRP